MSMPTAAEFDAAMRALRTPAYVAATPAQRDAMITDAISVWSELVGWIGTHIAAVRQKIRELLDPSKPAVGVIVYQVSELMQAMFGIVIPWKVED